MDRMLLAFPVPASVPPLLLLQKREDHRHTASRLFFLCILVWPHCSSFLWLTQYFWTTLVCITSLYSFHIFKWFSWLQMAKMLGNFWKPGLLKTLGEMLCIILLLVVDAGVCLPVHHTMTSEDILSTDIWGIAACRGLPSVCLALTHRISSGNSVTIINIFKSCSSWR